MARRFCFVEQSTNASRRILSALFGAAVGRPDAVGQQAVELLLESVSPTPESLRRLGELALAARTMPEPLFVGFTSALIGRRNWRNPSLRITAHDTATGERVVFMPGHGIGLGRACAASSAVPGVFPPVAVHRRRFMDGGSCSATNADLAGGAERALVLSLLARGNAAPPTAMLGEIAALERGGTRVHAAWPDDASVAATDGDPLDPGIVPLLARAGRAQGRRDAPAVAALWS
jgi:NTE family protein